MRIEAVEAMIDSMWSSVEVLGELSVWRARAQDVVGDSLHLRNENFSRI